MKERGIILCDWQVQAVLDGRKTRHTVPVEPQPPEGWGGISDTYALATHCPFGKVGDRLWVKETWWHERLSDQENAAFGDGTMLSRYDKGTGKIFRIPGWTPTAPHWRKRPSIHMPRWASRITLEITGVRVERVHEITEEDARAEGIDMDVPKAPHVPGMGATHPSAVFSDLWDSSYAKRGFGWDSNPWVWAITFEVIK